MRYVILAGEEAGPVSNKLGGIWEVIDAEAKTLAPLSGSKKIEDCRIILMGPYFKTSGADWHTGKRRITDLKGLDTLEMDEPLRKAMNLFGDICDIKTASIKVGEKNIDYILFDTSCYSLKSGEYGGITLLDEIKKEAYDIVGLDSLSFEATGYGREYSHYLALSHAISTFARSLSFFEKVSLHCHEFGVFYAAARLKKLGTRITSVATFHATIPGRNSGAKVLEKLAANDSTWPPWTPIGLAQLESLAKYADRVTFVGDSTGREAKLFHGIDGLVVRNGMDVRSDKIDWDKKEKNRKKIQRFLSENIYEYYGGDKIDPGKILPIYTISRLELENKGYPDLLKALTMYDRIMQHHIANGKIDEETKIICFLITSHGPKEKKRLPKGFPVYLPAELLVGDEVKLKQMVKEHRLHIKDLITGGRVVASVVYPTWVGKDDGGLNMTVDEIASGCVAAVFPSRYDPFLLTGLEAGKEATPVIVSRVCGFSDAVKEWRVKRGLMGGVMLVDNIKPAYLETLTDYAMGLETITKNYLRDRSKYMMMCGEALRLAIDMDWEEPVKKYYEILTT